MTFVPAEPDSNGRHPRLHNAASPNIARHAASDRAGISQDTFGRWRKQSADFAEALKKAEAEAIARNVALVQKAAGGSWQAAAWWLERRHPNDFARTERLQHGGSEGKEITLKVVYDREDNKGF